MLLLPVNPKLTALSHPMKSGGMFGLFTSRDKFPEIVSPIFNKMGDDGDGCLLIVFTVNKNS
jgi:hypothetical protein